MERITANNETKWASSFIPYSQFILHRKLVTDHSKHSLGSEVLHPELVGEKFHWEAPGFLQISLLPSIHAKGAQNNPIMLCYSGNTTASFQAPWDPTADGNTHYHGF